MPLLNLTEAARVAGKSRATIHKYVNSGKLSTTTANDGSRRIDTSELLRVFGDTSPTSAPEADDPARRAVLATIDALQSQVDILKHELSAAHDREERLLVMLEQNSIALTAKTGPITPPTEVKKPGFFSRFFGSKLQN